MTLTNISTLLLCRERRLEARLSNLLSLRLVGPGEGQEEFGYRTLSPSTNTLCLGGEHVSLRQAPALRCRSARAQAEATSTPLLGPP